MSKENILEIVYYKGKNSPPLENCLECGEKLTYEWTSRKNQSEAKGEVRGKPANWWTQTWGGFCRKCEKSEKGNFYPRVIFKDEKIKDISWELETEYQPERKLISKIATTLLPKQKLKIRFTENYGVGTMEPYGLTSFYQDPQTGWEVLNICFPIKLLNNREKTNPGILCEAIAYQLAHASNEVNKNPHRSGENVANCDCKAIISSRSSQVVAWKHEGAGYDKIWHDKFAEFRERIKNESLAADLGYVALGKEFILHDNLPRSVWGPEGEIAAIVKLDWKTGKEQPKNEFKDWAKEKKPSPTNNKEQKVSPETNKKIYFWGAITFVLITSFFFFLIIHVRKRKLKSKKK